MIAGTHYRQRMTLIVSCLSILAWGGLAIVAAAAPTADVSTADLLKEFETGVSPFDVGNRAQLFVDRVLVRQTERVWFTQHQGKKHPDNPLVKADQPWEGWRLEIFGSVIYDEQGRVIPVVHNAGMKEFAHRIANFGYGPGYNRKRWIAPLFTRFLIFWGNVWKWFKARLGIL